MGDTFQYIKELAVARKEENEAREELLKFEVEHLGLEHARLKDKVEQAKKRVNTVDMLVRGTALFDFENQRPLPEQVKVVDGTEVVIHDENKAREWAMENFKPALKLDESKFKDGIKLQIVPEEIGEVEHMKKVRIDSDLSELLEDKDENSN